MTQEEMVKDQQDVSKEEGKNSLTLEQQRREKRKAEALRANLRKRKEQKRGRTDQDD